MSNLISHIEILKCVEPEFLNKLIKKYKGGNDVSKNELFKAKDWYKINDSNMYFMGHPKDTNKDNKIVMVYAFSLDYSTDELGIRKADKYGGRKK